VAAAFGENCHATKPFLRPDFRRQGRQFACGKHYLNVKTRTRVSSKRSRNKDFTHIGSLIEQLQSRVRKNSNRDLSALWDCWDSLVGPLVAANAQPAVFKGKLLLVHVSSSTWLQQLQFLKSDMIRKINTSLGQHLVEEIKFKIGPLK
jgi:predicted nucleic acid-binding Zn ribbon protein